MNWISVVWPMIASACLTLAAVHAVIGLKQKTPANLWFSLTAVGAAATAACELASMRADTAEKWAAALRWGHLAFFVLVFSLVWFVRSYFRAGRLWLGWTAIAVRAGSLAINFGKPPNLNYAAITGVQSLPIWFGERVFLPVGTPSRWTRVGELSGILLLIFMIDATRTVWLSGDRRRAVICGSTVLFLVAATSNAAAIHAGLIRSPYLVSVAYLGILAAMSYDLTRDVVKTSELSRRLQATEAGLRESRNHALSATGAAEQAEERFRLVVEAAPNAMIMVDPAGRITLVNAQAEAVFGYARAELIGLSIERLIPERYHTGHPGDRGRYFASPSARAMGAGRELFGLRKDGSEVPVEVGLNPIRSPEGVFALASVIDITERKRSELELEQQRSELAHLSRVTMLGELSGSLAHELNQPLSAILSNAQAAQRFLASDAPNLEEVREILKDIVEQDKRAGEVIQRLRLLLMKGEVHRQVLDLSEVLLDVLKLVRSDLVNQGVSLGTELAPDLPAVFGDRVQVQQVVLNLVMNGCDAMSGIERPHRRLIVKAAHEDGGGVRVSIADHGCGIPRETLSRVFEPFFTTKRQGMGLGLAVCRSIIEAHNGRLWAESEPGEGATFHFMIPVAEAGS